MLLSGTTGKLTGYALSKENRSPIINATIFIKELKSFVTTDVNGYFYKLMLPPGTYTLMASSIGHKQTTISEITINSDKTTKIIIEMETMPVVSEPVTITAAKNLINADITSSTLFIDNSAYKHLPKAKNFADLFSFQPGIVKYDNNIHIRGGRAGEVLYVLDGIPIKDILYSGANAITISASSIQEMTLLNSGFAAEYGNAESAVINIITKEGGDHFAGSFELNSDAVTSYSNDEVFASITAGGPEPVTNILLPMLGINLPGNLQFFTSLNFNLTDGDYRFNKTIHSNFKKRKINLLGGLFRFNYSEKQNNLYDGSIKLKYENANYNIVFSYSASGERIYRYEIPFKNRMDSGLVDENSGKHYSLKWTQTPADNIFYDLTLGILNRSWNLSVAGLTPDKYNPIWYSQDINSDGYNDLSMAQFWSRSRTNIFTVKGNLNYQYNRNHFFKTGFEINYEEIFATEIQYPGNIPDREIPGDYPSYGEFHWNLNNYSSNGNVFLQDKMEYEGLVINAGFRLDYFSPGEQVKTEKFKKAWEEATQIKNETGQIVELKVEDIRFYFSPRFGISHPVTDQSAIFFNYGHFYQLPERQYIFRDPYAAKGWIGNPNLKSPKTVCYEFGFSQSLFNILAFSVKGFYKDYFDYIGSLEVGPSARRLFMFYNSDYASSKGFEVTINKNYSDNFSLDANYTYSTSKGRSESPFEESYAIWQGSGLLPMEFRMPWDQNHNINLLLTYYISNESDFYPEFLKNFGCTLKWNYGSGFPYTPEGKNIRLAKMSKQLPFTSQVDLRIEKRINLYDITLNFYVDCINIFNRKNVKEVNPLTGNPYSYGDVFDSSGKRILTYKEILSKLDSSKFYGMRQLLFGFKLEI